MTVYSDEPKTAAELMARYRDVKRRLYPVPPRTPNHVAAVDAETILVFAPAAAVPADRARKLRKQAEQAQRAVRLADARAQAGDLPTGSDPTGGHTESQRQTQAGHLNLARSDLHDGSDVSRAMPGRTARAALRAVSERTSIPVDAILGRQRRSEIAAARHEAIWRIREATKWSLPRIGRFFDGRDHTTVLNSLRRMEDRAARDPELHAYMHEFRQPCSTQRPPSR
jgi:Bacterial dnaA protein helix-turn-helix